MRRQGVQSRAGTTNVTRLKSLERVCRVIDQHGARVIDWRRERLWTGIATVLVVLACYISDFLFRQAREGLVPRIVREVGECQCTLDERNEYGEVLELHLEGLYEQ